MMKPIEQTKPGRLAVAQDHAAACWQKLAEHAHGGRCTCHVGPCGSVHVIAGCVTGRMLHDEYWIAAERVRELSKHEGQLEFGDFESEGTDAEFGRAGGPA